MVLENQDFPHESDNVDTYGMFARSPKPVFNVSSFGRRSGYRNQNNYREMTWTIHVFSARFVNDLNLSSYVVQIGFVNYTKQLFLNGHTSACLVENCYVCRCVET